MSAARRARELGEALIEVGNLAAAGAVVVAGGNG